MRRNTAILLLASLVAVWVMLTASNDKVTKKDSDFEVALAEVGMMAGAANECDWKNDPNYNVALEFIKSIKNENRQGRFYKSLFAGMDLGRSAVRSDNGCYDFEYRQKLQVSMNDYRRLLIENTVKIESTNKDKK